ncbi:hypothetical protein [Streptomyces griseofuscus]
MALLNPLTDDGLTRAGRGDAADRPRSRADPSKPVVTPVRGEARDQAR